MAVKATKFDHVAITVSDTQKSLDFYVGKLGLRQVEQHALEGDKVDEANGLQGARAQSTRLIAPESNDVLIDLLEYWDHEQQNHVTHHGSVGSCHFALVVEDLPAAVEELQNDGVEFISGPVNLSVPTWSQWRRASWISPRRARSTPSLMTGCFKKAMRNSQGFLTSPGL